MVKKTFFCVAALLLIFVHTLFAQTTVKVAVFPFDIFAQNSQQGLKNKIIRIISDRLEQDGAKVVIIDREMDIADWNYADFKEEGIKLGVDYILTGSVFVAGKGISIDSNLINIYEKDRISPLYANSEDQENLFAAVNKIGKEISGKIFQKVVITDIEIKGNKRVEADAILRVVNSQPGDLVKPVNITQDLKTVYGMGYFDDVQVNQVSHDKGVKLVFNVVEKPSIRKVSFNKNYTFEDEELAEIIDTRTGSILNFHKINSDVNRIRLMYTEKNYHNSKIDYEVVPLKNSQADIIFHVQEGNKIRVEEITFEGNNHFSDKKIKKVMETSEKGLFSFFTSSGDLNETEVQNDVIRIESLYKNNGFIDTKVSDPIVNVEDKRITIHFKIEEGDQYVVEQIDISGDLIVPKEEILEKINSKTSELYNRENIRKDIAAITDVYLDEGFANVDVVPVVKKSDTEEKFMLINYTVKKGEPVYFRRVNISGNLKTRDKVIRREIKIDEQGQYSKKDIQASFKMLNRLDFFSNIDIQAEKTQTENMMDLNVKVEEKQTGSFSFGGGYSSEEAGFLMVSVVERNLFGNGQQGKVSAKLSEDSILYDIGLFEPYIFDTRVSGGFNIYREEVEYDYYDKDAYGLSLTLGYKLADFTRIGIVYNLENFDISDVDTANTTMTPGSFLSSSIRPYIKYDSRNDMFMPTEGQRHSFSIEYAGEFMGSDLDYTKYLAESGIYFPLFWKFIGMLHAEGGYIDDRSSSSIDIDYKKFYLGGMNSIRGFDKYDINGNIPGDSRRRGGDMYVQFNAELTFPITEKYKLVGVLFYDRGDVYKDIDEIDFGDQYSSVGAGIRWNSPLGPLRIEYGWVIDGKEARDSGDGQFEFSVGASF